MKQLNNRTPFRWGQGVLKRKQRCVEKPTSWEDILFAISTLPQIHPWLLELLPMQAVHASLLASFMNKEKANDML